MGLTICHGWWKMWDKDDLCLACVEVIENGQLSSIIMSTRRDDPRKARQRSPIAVGPLRNGHRAALKKIWDERPCLPSVASRKAWACTRGIDPAFVNRWFYRQAQKARASAFELDTQNVGYDLDVEGGSPVERLTPATPPPKRDPILCSTTPEGLPELSYYEYSASSETGLQIPFSPGQSSSPIFGSSFYSPKLTLGSPPDAYGHLVGIERFLFTPPRPPKRKRTAQSLSHSQHIAEELRTRIHQNASPPPVSPTPNNRLPPLPLAPRKPRQSRGSHDILNFRIQDDPRLRFSPPTLSPMPMASGYSVPYRIGPAVQQGADMLNLSTFSDLRTIVAKTSRLIDQKRGGCIGDNQSLNNRDNQTTPPFTKCLRTIGILCAITRRVCPFRLSVSDASIKTSIDRIAHLPSQSKHRWLHRVHRRPTRTP